MGWQLDLLRASEDLEITQQEVTGLMEELVGSAVQAMVLLAIMTMFVKEFYGILGPKKFAKQEAEVLEIAGEIW